MKKNGKKELVSQMVEAYAELHPGERLTKLEAGKVYDALEQAVKALVAEDGDILDLRSFVRFEKYLAKPRLGYNPSTGEPIEIPAKVRTRTKAKF